MPVEEPVATLLRCRVVGRAFRQCGSVASSGTRKDGPFRQKRARETGPGHALYSAETGRDAGRTYTHIDSLGSYQ